MSNLRNDSASDADNDNALNDEEELRAREELDAHVGVLARIVNETHQSSESRRDDRIVENNFRNNHANNANNANENELSDIDINANNGIGDGGGVGGGGGVVVNEPMISLSEFLRQRELQEAALLRPQARRDAAGDDAANGAARRVPNALGAAALLLLARELDTWKCVFHRNRNLDNDDVSGTFLISPYASFVCVYYCVCLFLCCVRCHSQKSNCDSCVGVRCRFLERRDGDCERR